MFYRIEKDRVEETSAENWESGQSGVAVLPTKSGKKKWTSVQLICSDSVRTTSIFASWKAMQITCLEPFIFR